MHEVEISLGTEKDTSRGAMRVNICAPVSYM